MPMPNYRIQGVPQLQQQQGPLGALADFGKSKALSAGLEAAFPGGGLVKEGAEAVLPTLFNRGGMVHPDAKKDMQMHEAHLLNEGGWADKLKRTIWGDPERNARIKAERSTARDNIRKSIAEKNKVSKGDVGSVIGSLLGAGFFSKGGPAKPAYMRMGGMTPGPLGMSDMLAAGKGKDVSKVIYKKKGGDIEDTMEIAYHAPLAAKPQGDK